MRGGRDREVERGGRGRALSPRLAEALHSEEERPARRLQEAEGWARVESRGGPQPALGGLEGGGGGSSGPWASLRSSCILFRLHKFLNFFLWGSRTGAVGIGPRGLPPWAGGTVFRVVAGSQFFSRYPERPLSALLGPQHVVKPRCFGCLPVGGAGESEHFLITSSHRFLFHSRARVLTLSLELAPTHSARCLCSSGGCAHPGQVTS